MNSIHNAALSSAPRDDPAVSVLIPAFNHEHYIEEAVRSVWAQTTPPLELIAIDDGSADRTAAILETLRSSSPLPMQVISRENRGVSATLNEAVGLARGKWIALLASDDYYHPDFISSNLLAAQAYPDGSIAIHSDAYAVDDDGVVSTRLSRLSDRVPAQGEAFASLIARTGFVIAPTVFTSRSAIIQCGMFDERMIAEDFDFHLRLSRAVDFHYIDKALYYSRGLPGSLGRKPWAWGKDILAAIEKHDDVLGAELSRVLRERCQIVSDACFVHGGFAAGILWGAKAFQRGESLSEKLAVALHTARGAALLSSRYALVRHLPDQVLRQLRLAKGAVRSRRSEGR